MDAGSMARKCLVLINTKESSGVQRIVFLFRLGVAHSIQQTLPSLSSLQRHLHGLRIRVTPDIRHVYASGLFEAAWGETCDIQLVKISMTARISLGILFNWRPGFLWICWNDISYTLPRCHRCRPTCLLSSLEGEQHASSAMSRKVKRLKICLCPHGVNGR